MDLKLKGKSVLVTGASKGIGAACARAFAAHGCNVHLVARTLKDLEEVQKGIKASHPEVQVSVTATDLKSGDNVRSLIAENKEQLDILVNNAGAIPAGSIEDTNESVWRDAWDLKVFGYINATREAYRIMKEKGSGVIINIIGAAGNRPFPTYIAGGTGNAALMALCEGLGGTSLKDGIRVVGISPGRILTDRLVELYKGWAKMETGDESNWKDQLDKAEFKPGDVDDIANLTLFVASPLGKNITGTVITSDGGWSSRRGD